MPGARRRWAFGEQRRATERAGLTTRAMRYRDHESGRPRGTPPLPPQVRARVRREVATLLAVYGPSLREPTAHSLRPDLNRHLLQEVLRDLKKAHCRKSPRRRAAERHTVVVHYADAIWLDDETHLGRDRGRTEDRGKVLRNPASRRSLDLAAGRPARDPDFLRALERTAAERGDNPLVYSSDSDPCLVTEEVERFLWSHRNVHLRNVPRTPEHNLWAERAIRELKEESGLHMRAFVLGAAAEALGRIQQARWRLDVLQPRACLAWKTPLAMDAALPRAYDHEDWRVFYETALRAVERAVHGIDSPRARRRAKREGTFWTLRVFGLVTRYRGGRIIPLENAEAIS